MASIEPATGGPARPGSWIGQLGVLIGLAVAADWYAPGIFIGHSLVLGLVFYWIGLRLLGPHRALPILVASMTALAFKWSRFDSAALVGLEGLAVGWAWRRRRNPLLADVMFWAFVGTPLSWFLYRNVFPIPRPSLEHALIVQPVNGLIAVWFAYLGLEFATMAGRSGGEAPQQSFRTVLLQRYVAFGTLPALVVGLLAAGSFEARSISEAKENIRSGALHLAGLLGAHVARGSTVVQQVAARQVEPAWFADPTRMSRELGAVQAETGIFLTMLAADADGKVIGAAPESVVAGSRSGGMRVSDREYFAVPMATGRPHVSGVFRGRGFGRDLLIAISAPALTRAGERMGVVEGSLQVDTLDRLMRQGGPGEGLRLLLADHRLQVITAKDIPHAPLSKLAGTSLGEVIRTKLNTPLRFTADVGSQRVSFLSVTVPVPGLDWTLTVQREWSEVLQPVLEAYAWTLAVALGAAVVAYYFTSWSLRGILLTWRDLIEFSHAPTTRFGLLQHSNRPDLPQEFRVLLFNLSNMAHRLEVEQGKREQLLAELESRVKQRTQELEKALVLAQSADRAKSAFLATVSHELRTPLTAINTGVRLLRMSGVGQTDLAVRTLGTMERAGQVLMSVISDVLDYSRLEAGGVTIEIRRFRPADVLADVAAIIDPAARKANLVLRVVPGHEPELEWNGDVQRVRQVVLNLAGNAVKFTGEGYIEVRTWVAAAAPGVPARLWFAVKDSGPGIPPDRLGAVFEPFVQLETNRVVSQAGTGLGLSISRRLVEMMGGSIAVRSTVGEGSEFTFWIPGVVPPANPPAPGPAVG